MKRLRAYDGREVNLNREEDCADDEERRKKKAKKKRSRTKEDEQQRTHKKHKKKTKAVAVSKFIDDECEQSGTCSSDEHEEGQDKFEPDPEFLSDHDDLARKKHKKKDKKHKKHQKHKRHKEVDEVAVHLALLQEQRIHDAQQQNLADPKNDNEDDDDDAAASAEQHQQPQQELDIRRFFGTVSQTDDKELGFAKWMLLDAQRALLTASFFHVLFPLFLRFIAEVNWFATLRNVAEGEEITWLEEPNQTAEFPELGRFRFACLPESLQIKVQPVVIAWLSKNNTFIFSQEARTEYERQIEQT